MADNKRVNKRVRVISNGTYQFSMLVQAQVGAASYAMWKTDSERPHGLSGQIYDDDDHPTDLSEMGGGMGIPTEIYGDEYGGE